MPAFPRHKTDVLWLASLSYKFRQQHLGQYCNVNIGLYSRVCIFLSIFICIFHVNKEETQKLSYFKFREDGQDPDLEGKWKQLVQQSNHRQSSNIPKQLLPNVCLNCSLKLPRMEKLESSQRICLPSYIVFAPLLTQTNKQTNSICIFTGDETEKIMMGLA